MIGVDIGAERLEFVRSLGAHRVLDADELEAGEYTGRAVITDLAG